MIHARIDLSGARAKSVGTFNPDGKSPEVWFMADGVIVPEASDTGSDVESEEECLLLCLSMADAAALSTLLQQSILACINGQGRVN
jgi:hypothetical protein